MSSKIRNGHGSRSMSAMMTVCAYASSSDGTAARGHTSDGRCNPRNGMAPNATFQSMQDWAAVCRHASGARAARHANAVLHGSVKFTVVCGLHERRESRAFSKHHATTAGRFVRRHAYHSGLIVRDPIAFLPRLRPPQRSGVVRRCALRATLQQAGTSLFSRMDCTAPVLTWHTLPIVCVRLTARACTCCRVSQTLASSEC